MNEYIPDPNLVNALAGSIYASGWACMWVALAFVILGIALLIARKVGDWDDDGGVIAVAPNTRNRMWPRAVLISVILPKEKTARTRTQFLGRVLE